jgi:hypothetical protein
MIFDCFLFNNEFELLRLRCEELRPLNVTHILVEATTTLTGFPKPLYYEENKERFADCNIINLAVTDMPTGDDHWAREHHQRDAILRTRWMWSHRDTMIIADVDEIPKASRLRDWTGHCTSLVMDGYLCWLNCLAHKQINPVPKIVSYQWLRTHTPTQVRNEGAPEMPHAGWHFSWLCGPDVSRLKRKRDAIADFVAWPDKPLLDRVKRGPFLFLNNRFPKYLVENQAEFEHLIRYTMLQRLFKVFAW